MQPMLDSANQDRPRFRNRIHAADLLGNLLQVPNQSTCLVLAMSPAAIPMAKFLSGKLKCEFDLCLVQRFGFSTNPNYDLGYVTEDGDIHLSPISDKFHLSDETIQAFAQSEIDRLRNLRRLYTPDRASIDPADRNVILVGDGSTKEDAMVAIARSLQARDAKRITVASSVISCESVQKLLCEGVETVCLRMTLDSVADSTSEFYECFLEPSPLDIIETLDSCRLQN